MIGEHETVQWALNTNCTPGNELYVILRSVAG